MGTLKVPSVNTVIVDCTLYHYTNHILYLKDLFNILKKTMTKSIFKQIYKFFKDLTTGRNWQNWRKTIGKQIKNRE